MVLVNVVLAKRILVTKRVTVARYRTILRRLKAMLVANLLAKFPDSGASKREGNKAERKFTKTPFTKTPCTLLQIPSRRGTRLEWTGTASPEKHVLQTRPGAEQGPLANVT